MSQQHSIHCAGYRGAGNPFDESVCDCNPVERRSGNGRLVYDKTTQTIKTESQRDDEDPPVCRLQFPDGTVPGNAREAAEGWKRWADEYRQRAADMAAAVDANWVTHNRVWKALGIATMAEANGKAIDELVADLKRRAELWERLHDERTAENVLLQAKLKPFEPMSVEEAESALGDIDNAECPPMTPREIQHALKYATDATYRGEHLWKRYCEMHAVARGFKAELDRLRNSQ